jgi:hypothetical protein
MGLPDDGKDIPHFSVWIMRREDRTMGIHRQEPAMSHLARAPLALLIFAGALALCMLPTALAARRDARTIRGVSVWTKPQRFMASLALFAATTAVLMLAAGADANLNGIAALVIATSTIEVAYITVQAGRGQPSHYNTSDTLHIVCTVVMALGAIALTASQAWLAVVIARTNPAWLASVGVLGAVTGLALTFVLATVSGFMLGGRRPPGGRGLPLVGWQRRGDLRPAHFLGVHVQQIVPALGLIAERLPASAAHAAFAALACVYVLAWAMLTRSAAHGASVPAPG